ncbi:uncharacterized protein EV420DRAFT_1568889 [Desarmillaria tabescens]|uniref:Uncharacterized protein n=1 Tax=Armillaria tabescens TaxID=1929756 RepID=A0AA39MUV7_ARMTA|nr:uncharacterized protein EV420DRAFT_1568889 [Desarmillaria tabescens]KAK0447467.1 hypothetical protein EV420DRAFT_1568889 [Desarmillaria tabescens]
MVLLLSVSVDIFLACYPSRTAPKKIQDPFQAWKSRALVSIEKVAGQQWMYRSTMRLQIETLRKVRREALSNATADIEYISNDRETETETESCRQ